MSLDAMAGKVAKDTVTTGAKLAETGLKKAWSILDAAAQKKPASDIISPRAIQSMQGNPEKA